MGKAVWSYRVFMVSAAVKIADRFPGVAVIFLSSISAFSIMSHYKLAYCASKILFCDDG
jgi:hypothetical protein